VSYAFHLLAAFSIAAMLAMSINLIVGYCGRVTLAHASFMAIGAYTYALASLTLGWSFGPATVSAIATSAIASLFLSLPARRFKGDQFFLLTLVFQVVVFNLVRNWGSPDAPFGSIENLTNGPYGIAGVPRPQLLGVMFSTDWSRAILALSVATGCATLCWVVLSAPLGRLLKAARDDELAARSLGKDVDGARARAFAISCGIAGAAGAVYASHVTYVDPSLASLDESVLLLCTILIGGSGNRLAGSLAGAMTWLAIPELLRLFRVPGADASNIRLLLFGVLLMVIIHLRPQGIAGAYRIE